MPKGGDGTHLVSLLLPYGHCRDLRISVALLENIAGFQLTLRSDAMLVMAKRQGVAHRANIFFTPIRSSGEPRTRLLASVVSC